MPERPWSTPSAALAGSAASTAPSSGKAYRRGRIFAADGHAVILPADHGAMLGRVARLESYQRHLFHHKKANGAPLSFRTQAQRIIAVKSFFAWMLT